MTDLDKLAKSLTKAQREELFGDPRAHVTRYSDSSLYDEVCILCGLTDGSIMCPREHTTLNTDCAVGLALRNHLKGQNDGHG